MGHPVSCPTVLLIVVPMNCLCQKSYYSEELFNQYPRSHAISPYTGSQEELPLLSIFPRPSCGSIATRIILDL